jgi:Secretion system C-terminal sorting domain
MSKFLFSICASLMLFSVQSADAQLLLNEMLVNPPGSDEPFEFVELKGSPGSTLNNIYMVVFESDSGSAGNADVVIPLNGVTLGSNGLLFIGTSLGYPSIPSETVFKDTLLFGLPQLENGSISFAVLFSPIPMLKDVDYDTNNDGVLDLPNGAQLQDAVGWTNGDLSALIYGGVILTQSAGTPDAAVRFFDNNTPFSAAAWYNGDLVDSDSFDPLEVSSNMPQGSGITPGNINIPNNGTGINDLIVSNLTIYPNPSEGVINIESLNLNESALLSVYSIDGRLVSQSELINSTVDLTNLDSGLYWVELRTNREVKRAQLVLSY